MSRAAKLLLLCVVLTVILYAIPFGGLIIWPIMLFATLAHEMGHGVAALTCGGEFHQFRLWADGSGVANTGGLSAPWMGAVVSAGGLVGPALAAMVLFALGRSASWSRRALYGASAAFILADVLVVRNTFGLFYVGALGLLTAWLARNVEARTAQLVVVFMAMQLSLSVFSTSDYLFTDVARTSGGTMPSDVAQMANVLGGPYWLWGLVVGAFSVGVLVVGLRVFLRGAR
ncbi:MAG: M50 family metallopeptidase [Myxococcota bacterium]